ncbi:hypothetical protein Anas_05719 [Armadillidium nasatum]|uniref:Uncharacterized protein n=1 Tax=Armadillidium nasatum TaxID=96803 RepID=A0A5N5SSS2_9CRUS|nr:hypothetical protein Anas_05719 [Armadillidium nasatum]
MDSLVSKISSALKKNKDLEKLDICQGFIISKKEDIENSPHHPLVIEKDNDIDLIKRKHEQIKIRFGRLIREKTGT